MEKRDRINRRRGGHLGNVSIQTPPLSYNDMSIATLNYPLVFHNLVSKSIDDSATNLIFSSTRQMFSAQIHFHTFFLLDYY